jgi:hypothetical protein
MFSRKVSYASTADGGPQPADPTQRAAAELRAHVRDIDHCAPFSPDWLALAEPLARIASAAQAERCLAAAAAGADKARGHATLWESLGLSACYLLEEGKLNLCLRLLHECARARRRAERAPAELAAAAAAAQLDVASLEARGLQIECALTAIFRSVLEYIEPWQTIDMPELLEHCAEVLERAAAPDRAPAAAGTPATQEAAVPAYLALLMSHADSLDERRLTELLIANALLPRAARLAAAHGERLPSETVGWLGLFARAVCESEDFKTDRTRYLPRQPCMPPPLASSDLVGAVTDARVRAAADGGAGSRPRPRSRSRARAQLTARGRTPVPSPAYTGRSCRAQGAADARRGRGHAAQVRAARTRGGGHRALRAAKQRRLRSLRRPLE